MVHYLTLACSPCSCTVAVNRPRRTTGAFLILRLLPANNDFSKARSAGLEPATFSVRSQTRSRTGSDREGQGETKPCFYRQLSTSKGTGTDRERHGVVVPLWYELAADLEFGLKLTRPAGTTGF